MKIFGEHDSPAKKGIVVLGGLGASAAVFLLAAIMLFHSPEPVRSNAPAAKKKESRSPVPAGAVVSATGALVRPPPAPPSEPVVRNDVRLSRAMDDSNVRQMVRMLMEAAASENAPLKASMLGALARSPAPARPILESELAKAGHPAVRSALQEALSRSK